MICSPQTFFGRPSWLTILFLLFTVDAQMHSYNYRRVPHRNLASAVVHRPMMTSGMSSLYGSPMNPLMITANSNSMATHGFVGGSNGGGLSNRILFPNHNSAIINTHQPSLYSSRNVMLFPTSKEELIDNEPDRTAVTGQESSDRTGLSPFQKIKFISPKQELAQTRWWYDAPVHFSARGMEHLYLLNRIVMDYIQPKPGLPSGVVGDDFVENFEEVVKQNRVPIVTHYQGFILCAIIAFGLAITIPIMGILICCCRCNGSQSSSSSSSSASARAQRHSRLEDSPLPSHSQIVAAAKKRRKCKYPVESDCEPYFRSMTSSIFFCNLLALTFFVICAFVTNDYVRTGLHQLPHSLNQSLDDVQLYLNNTQFEVSTLLVTNFGQLEKELDTNLDKSGTILKNRLALVSQAIALENLTDIVLKLEEIHSDLDQLSKETEDLGKMLSDLRLGLRKARENLEDVFNVCDHSVCLELKNKYQPLMPKFQVSPQFDHLPNMTGLIQHVAELLRSDIVHEVQRGKQAFDRIGVRIQTAVNSSIPEIKHQISLVGRELYTMAEEINEALRLPFQDIQNGKRAVYEGSQLINEYEIYRWYGGLIGASIVLTILALYTLGLMCGCCKKQPSIYEYRTRGLRPPSTWPLTCGTILVFFFFTVAALVTIALFLTGTVMDRVGCYYLEHPSDPEGHKLFDLVQRQLDQKKRPLANRIQFLDGQQPNFVDVIDRCHQNVSLFRALDLNKNHKFLLKNNRIVDANNLDSVLEFKNRYQIEDRLEKLLNSIDMNPDQIQILSEKGYRLLNRLRDTQLGTFNFSMFAGLLNQKVTSIDLMAISSDLNKGALALPHSQVENRSQLKYISFVIDSYQTRMFNEIQECIRKLKDAARKIEKKAQYGSKGLREALSELIGQTRQAQQFLAQNGREEIRKVANAFKSDLNSLIDQYVGHVKEQVQNQIGRCEPVSRAVNASIVSVCKEIVLPYNGYWFSISQALLLFLPAALLATCLSSSFNKLKRNKDHRFFENDSSIENLEDDDIPLAHVGPKTENYGYNGRRSMQYACAAPSAPMPAPEDNWSSGAASLPMYTRPPPYSFES